MMKALARRVILDIARRSMTNLSANVLNDYSANVRDTAEAAPPFSVTSRRRIDHTAWIAAEA